MTGESMPGVLIHGSKTLSLNEYPVPVVGSGQVLLEMQASALCGSDLRALYRPKTPKNFGPDGYRNVIAGHEPCGKVVQLGPNVSSSWKEGDRVIVYHIHGCGTCRNCRNGQYISCTDLDKREAYGWQRNGGHSKYILADQADLVKLFEPLTYVDGSMIACGLGTAYAATLRADISGRDTVLITGLGPVGLGTALLAMKEGAEVYGIELDEQRAAIARNMGVHIVDKAKTAQDVLIQIKDTNGPSVVIDCTGHPQARHLGLEVAREWGRVVFVGEGNTITFDVSELVIHKSLTIYGSWVSSIAQMEDLVEKLVKWNLSPEDMMVSHVFPLEEADLAYKLFDAGNTGKVVLASAAEVSRWQKKMNNRSTIEN
jgi:threonine dehydrogenase-like Zn-dependent dehydrogenase